MDKLTKISIIISVLIIAASVAYYLVIFLPHKDQEQLDIQKQQVATKAKQQKDAKDAADKQAFNLRMCLLTADSSGSDFWNNECKSQGLGDDCTLPKYNADRVDQSIKDDKNQCFKQYPQ